MVVGDCLLFLEHSCCLFGATESTPDLPTAMPCDVPKVLVNLELVVILVQQTKSESMNLVQLLGPFAKVWGDCWKFVAPEMLKGILFLGRARL